MDISPVSVLASAAATSGARCGADRAKNDEGVADRVHSATPLDLGAQQVSNLTSAETYELLRHDGHSLRLRVEYVEVLERNVLHSAGWRSGWRLAALELAAD